MRQVKEMVRDGIAILKSVVNPNSGVFASHPELPSFPRVYLEEKIKQNPKLKDLFQREIDKKEFQTIAEKMIKTLGNPSLENWYKDNIKIIETKNVIEYIKHSRTITTILQENKAFTNHQLDFLFDQKKLIRYLRQKTFKEKNLVSNYSLLSHSIYHTYKAPEPLTMAMLLQYTCAGHFFVCNNTKELIKKSLRPSLTAKNTLLLVEKLQKETIFPNWVQISHDSQTKNLKIKKEESKYIQNETRV